MASLNTADSRETDGSASPKPSNVPVIRSTSGISTLNPASEKVENPLAREKTLAEGLEDPYREKTREQIIHEAIDLADRCNLVNPDEFLRAALLAAGRDVNIGPVELDYLNKESSTKFKDKWTHPKILFYTACVSCPFPNTFQ